MKTKKMDNTIHKKELKKWLELIDSENPYPVDIFPEPNENQWRAAGKILEANGINSSLIFAKFGRMVWGNCCRSMKANSEIFEDEK